MNHNMNSPDQTCNGTRDQLALLLYGELSFDEEERVESHLDTCAECRQALDRQRLLHEAVDAAAVTPSPALLARSRADLFARLDQERPVSGLRAWWQGLQRNWNFQILNPVGAAALVALGFFGARLTPFGNFGLSQAGEIGRAHV